MKHSQSLYLLLAICSACSFATPSEKHASIPFYNLMVAPKEKLYVDYELTEQHPSLSCIVEPSASFEAAWELNGIPQHRSPGSEEITLYYDKAEGLKRSRLADKKGTLVITTLFIWGPGNGDMGFARCIYNNKK